MPTSVIDTADWRLVVPLRTALNLSGSRLTAAMTGAFGGPPAAEIDSAGGTITWVADPVTGLTDHLFVLVPRAARGDWLATGANGRPAQVTLIFDVHRTVSGSLADEWLGRSSVLVLPGSDSAAVAAMSSGFQPVLIAGQPGCSTLLPALQVGPQGPAGSAQSSPTLTAAAILSGHKVVRVLPDGTAAYASADQPAHAGTVLGLTVAAAQAGSPISIAITGPIDEPSWSFAPGPVWLGLAGALTQTAPQAGLLQQVGLALTPTRLLVGLAPPILL